MRRLVEIAVLALVASGCAGRVRPTGPDDWGNRQAPGMRGETKAEDEILPPVDTTTIRPVERADIEPLPLPEGVRPDDFDISLQYNRRVEYWLKYFQRYHDTFSAWLERMGRYEPYIREELTSAGLPSDLIYLGLIESGFATGATSSAGAVGIWQFMAGTARLEGMEVSTYVDERRDPIRATEAAVHHLKSLYRELGSWYLVAAAYNSGSGRVGRALESNAGGARGADSLFWRIEPVLPAETRDYVPKLLAASILAKYPALFGVQADPLPGPGEYETIRIDRPTDLAAIARASGASEEIIKRLNPQFLLGVTPPGRTVAVRVPAGQAARTRSRLADMPRRERVHDLRHRAGDGETPKAIADRFGVSLAALRKANHLKKKTQHLAEGRELIIPLGGASVALAESDDRSTAKRDQPRSERADSRRDEPATVAKAAPARSDDDDQLKTERKTRTEASADAAPAARKTRAGSTETIGADRDSEKSRVASADASRAVDRPAKQVASADKSPAKRYRVRKGDTLSGIAEDHGLTLARLRELNGLKKSSTIHPGQDLVVSARKPLVYRVRPGDTLSRIARAHGVTVGQLREWNGLGEDAVLHPGDSVELLLER